MRLSSRQGRQVLTTVTMLVLVGLLATGAWVGWRSLSAPVAENPTAEPRCREGVERVDVCVRTPEKAAPLVETGRRLGITVELRQCRSTRPFTPSCPGSRATTR